MSLLPRTLLLLDEPFTEAGGVYRCPLGSTFWRFAVRFAEHCEAFTLYVPLESSPAGGRETVADVGRLHVVGRPYYERIVSYYGQLPRIARTLRRQAQELVARHDLVVFRVPAPVAKFVVSAAAQAAKPLGMLVAGDITKQARWVTDRRGPAAWLGRLATGLLRRQEHSFARQCAFVGAWGQELLDVFRPDCPRVEICQDPSIEAARLTYRADTCRTPPVRLVRVCRLLPSKGIEYLLGALARLVQGGRAVTLDVVGDGDDSAYVQALGDLARQLEIAEHVTFHGPLAFGDDLFALLRAADLHVISSLGEGLPRVIAEGRAFCLPTVATSVGGIPTVVHDGEDGLLVPPRDGAALANAIARIIDDAELRRRIIARSWEIAQRSTVEYHAQRLAERIAEAIRAMGGARPL